MDVTIPVYLIDDDPRIRESMRLLLKSVGLSLETYATAQEFLDEYLRVARRARQSVERIFSA